MNAFGSRPDLLFWLRETDPESLKSLWNWADRTRKKHVGDQVHLRGLIEIGNRCGRDCRYCGLRRSNTRLPRYRMNREQILDCVDKAVDSGYGTVVLQGGEHSTLETVWIERVIRDIKARHDIAVTVSFGERHLDHYRIWREAGADRVLLKFETSDRRLFGRLHPAPPDGHEQDRIRMLPRLREMGYEIGSGIIVGLPGQNIESLADDLLLFAELDLDMIAVGPFVLHPDTPLAQRERTGFHVIEQVEPSVLMTMKMVALSRILVPSANIPATTALASIDPDGFAKGLSAGANIIMPNITPAPWRAFYSIYPGSISSKFNDMHNFVHAEIHKSGRVPGQGQGARTDLYLDR